MVHKAAAGRPVTRATRRPTRKHRSLPGRPGACRAAVHGNCPEFRPAVGDCPNFRPTKLGLSPLARCRPCRNSGGTSGQSGRRPRRASTPAANPAGRDSCQCSVAAGRPRAARGLTGVGPCSPAPGRHQPLDQLRNGKSLARQGAEIPGIAPGGVVGLQHPSGQGEVAAERFQDVLPGPNGPRRADRHGPAGRQAADGVGHQPVAGPVAPADHVARPAPWPALRRDRPAAGGRRTSGGSRPPPARPHPCWRCTDRGRPAGRSRGIPIPVPDSRSTCRWWPRPRHTACRWRARRPALRPCRSRSRPTFPGAARSRYGPAIGRPDGRPLQDRPAATPAPTARHRAGRLPNGWPAASEPLRRRNCWAPWAAAGCSPSPAPQPAPARSPATSPQSPCAR